jgi:enoyl-CoA hydratase
MDLALTGRMMDAIEAERSGLVARIFPQADLLKEVKAIAQTIADMPLLTSIMVKEAVNAAYETTLAEGTHFERRLFHACFATKDQKEGMAAFMEKRPAQFTNS